jgi:hypothetical protein
MLVKTRAEAMEYLDAVARLICAASFKEGKAITLDEGRRIAKVNIGYWTGYGDSETAKRVFELYDTKHPVFGTKQPTPEETFQAGVDMAKGKFPRKVAEKITAGRFDLLLD